MSELGVIGNKSKFASADVRLQLLKMQREYLIDAAQQAALDAMTILPSAKERGTYAAS